MISEAHQGMKHSPETVEKLRENGRVRTPARIASLKKTHASNVGRKLSPEHAAKLAQSNRDRIITPELREKMRQSHLGKKQSEETRAKKSAAMKGRGPRSEEDKQKMREGWARRRALTPLP